MLSLVLQEVLSPGRNRRLKNLPLQECDALLHEAGAPPIHTPLTVLQNLPPHVKERLYVVHTSALPPDCDLRVAPTGTDGTIRLDQRQLKRSTATTTPSSDGHNASSNSLVLHNSSTFDDAGNLSLSVLGNYIAPSYGDSTGRIPPLVFLRPTCVSDAWFMLNLLSNLPFFSSLSYAHAMEILEIAVVEVHAAESIIVPSHRRQEIICLVWEGTCVERFPVGEDVRHDDDEEEDEDQSETVWHAGDWTGPIALQPNILLAASGRAAGDMVAVSTEGVRVIILQVKDLEKILLRGSQLYRKYLAVQNNQEIDSDGQTKERIPRTLQGVPVVLHHVLEVLKFNSVLGRLPAHQKRALESIAEGPRVFQPGETLWKMGDRVDNAFLVMAGTAQFKKPILSGARRGVRRTSSTNQQLFEIESGRYAEMDKPLHNISSSSEYARLELLLADRAKNSNTGDGQLPLLTNRERHFHKTRYRYANKILARLYASRKYTPDCLFSLGTFLCDTSRMVSGELVRHQGSTVEAAVEKSTSSMNVEEHVHS